MSHEVFSKRIKELRITHGLTTRMMAEKIGLTNAAISYYENGKREPTLSVILAYAKYFDVTLDYLLGLSDEPLRKKE